MRTIHSLRAWLLTPVLLISHAALADKLVLVAGSGDRLGDGPAAEVKLSAPFGLGVDSSGAFHFVEMTGERVRRLSVNRLVTTTAGTGGKGFSGDGGPAINAQFNGMHHLLIAPNNDIFVADTWNNRVRKIDARTGAIRTIAGTGAPGQKVFDGDGGPATLAHFGGIYCLALDRPGENLFLADLDNRRIRAVNLKTGLVRTVAGNGKQGVPEDGADAANSPLVDPRAVAVDAKGNIYILERSANALRLVDVDGRIRTVVGTGQKGLSGDGGNAREATMNGPKHLCVDPDGNVLIADTENHVIRKYLPRESKIIRVAGTGKKGTGGLDGPPLEAELNQPHGVFAHPSGDVYICDSSNNRVLKITRQL